MINISLLIEFLIASQIVIIDNDSEASILLLSFRFVVFYKMVKKRPAPVKTANIANHLSVYSYLNHSQFDKE